MAYNITLTNGTALISGGLPDGTIDTINSSLTLVGKNYPGYGIFLNQNMVKLMENFANGSAPTAPLPGQLWWNSTTKYLNINTASTKGTANAVWKTIATMTYASSFTTTPVPGEQWYDTINGQLKVWNGSAWVTIGPAATTATGNSGAIPDTIAAVSPAATYVVLKFFINDTLVGIWSKEAAFTTAISGFAQVNRGLNLSTDLSQAYYGNADVALSLSVSGVKVPGTSFLRNDTSGTIAGALTLSGAASDGGLTFGQAGDFVGSVSSGNVTLRNQTNNRELILSLKTGGVQTPFFKGNWQTGLPEAFANPTVSSPALTLATKSYVDNQLGSGTGVSTFAASLNPDANVTYTLGNTTNRWSNVFTESVLVGNVFAANANVHTVYASGTILPTSNTTVNLGSTGMWFNTFYGVSVQAQYADLAERFETDQPYDPGTVVALGGIKEITAAAEELSEDVFGVISTRAAYLMNGAAGSDTTHPPVAVNGRVPVRVIGPIRKGDRLVSAGNGLARAGAKHELSPFNVIGRSLQDKLDTGEGTIEAIVKLNS
jgi:hypothetical protein